MQIQAQTGDPKRDDVVEVINPDGRGDVVLVCEHASNFIPADLHDLGLDHDALQSHIAWDPGALAVAKVMAEALDAPLVASRVSRLVHDCNRRPGAQNAIPEKSEIYDIPGNVGLPAEARLSRAIRYFVPFRNALASVIDKRVAAGRAPAIVTVHSFTPVYEGVKRDVDVGILHDVDARLADEILRIAEMEGDLAVRRNAPYSPQDGVTYTLSEQAIARGLVNVMIEIRNDLIGDATRQHAMAGRLTRYVKEGLASLADASGGTHRAVGAN